MQVTWHLLVMFFCGIYEIFEIYEFIKCFNQKIFFKICVIRFDIQWHVLPGIKCITEVWRRFQCLSWFVLGFVRFTSLCALFIWTSGKVTSIVSITYTIIFSKQVSRRWVPRGSPGKNKCSWNSGKKKITKLNFFSMYFIRTNKEIHLSFKNSEK